MATIHPSALVDANVSLSPGVVVGAHCVLEGEITIGADTVIGPGCVMRGPAQIGAANTFHAHCSIDASQDKKQQGAGGAVVLGDHNTVREFCTLHRATGEDATTVLGDRNWLMAYSHVAHDCVVGNDTVLGNLVQLGGHVEVADRAILGGGVLVHQWCRIGTLAIVGGGTAVRQDITPYANFTVLPHKTVVAVNKIGLERAGRTADIDTITSAYRILYQQGLALAEALKRLRELATTDPVLESLVNFVATVGTSGLARPRRRQVAEGSD